MKKVIGSVYVKIIALLGGFIAALLAMIDISVGFQAFMSVQLFRHIFDPSSMHILNPYYSTMMPGVGPCVLFLIICAALLGVSVWFSRKRRSVVWRRTDFMVFSACAFGVIGLCIVYAINRQLTAIDFIPIAWRRLMFLGIAYAAGMALFMETLARLRDKTLLSTIYWPQFFRRYPVKRPPGFVMLALLSGITLYLIFFSELRFVGVVISLILLCALSYFCVFVLSLSKKFEAANEEKLRAERFKAELITNVSHDIRTPLTSIINYVDLLGALPVEHEKFHEYVNVLEKKSARLNTLISDLMEASKAGTGNLPVKLEAIDLSEIIGQIAGEFDEIFSRRDLTLVLRLPEQPVFVQADAGHLWRVLENLFGNAAKYALPGTRAFAEISAQEEHSILSLKNTSQSPIDLADQELTEQFIRGDRARQTEGSGLGLYIAKSLMELMGGQLTIEVNGDLFAAEVRFG